MAVVTSDISRLQELQNLFINENKIHTISQENLLQYIVKLYCESDYVPVGQLGQSNVD